MLLTIKGFQGMIRPEVITRSEIQSDPTASPSVWNVEFWPRGTISKRAGFAATHSAIVTATTVKVFEWEDLTNTPHAMIFNGGTGTTCSDCWAVTRSTNASSYGDSVFTVIMSGRGVSWSVVSSASLVGCTTFAGSAVFVTKASSAMYWNGNTSVTAEDLSGSPFGAACCVGWGGYLFFGNIVDGSSVRRQSRVQWCSINEPFNWPSTYYIDLDPDDGDEITGMTLFGDQIVVFKANKIFTISWVGGQLLFQSTRRSTEVGCIAGDTLVQKNNAIYFLSRLGVYAFDGNNVNCLSDKISYLFTTGANQSLIPISKAVVYETHEQVWFAVPRGSSTYLNTIYVLDYRTGGWSAYNVEGGVYGFSNLTLTTNQIYAAYPKSYSTYADIKIGEETGNQESFLAVVTGGYLCKHTGTQDLTSGGTAFYFDAGWRSPWYDFGNTGSNKRIMRVTSLLDSKTTDQTVNIDAYIDWDEETIKNTDALQLSATSLVHTVEKRADFTRHCRAFQFTVSASSTAPTFTIHRFELDYLPKGRTLVNT